MPDALSSLAPRDADFWNRKLLAFLHDPADKAVDIPSHLERAKLAVQRAMAADADEQSFAHTTDHTAAAADRFPFPDPKASGLTCAFDGKRATFRHPLGGQQTLAYHKVFPSTAYCEEITQFAQPTQLATNSASPVESARLRFLAHWRLYRKWAVEKDYRFAYLPADTRLPDHSIWHHLGVVSALAGCIEGHGDSRALRPSFLKFQLGGVQEFIGAAKSTRDLWSGSFLFSWLMAVGMKRLAELQGPDSVIFPSLWGQPIFDWLCRHDWEKLKSAQKPANTWADLQPNIQDVLTPNLPNVFLALVPAGEGAEIAQEVVAAMQAEWKKIASVCWTACEKEGLTNNPADGAFSGIDRKARFDQQIANFLQVSWQVTPWHEGMPNPAKDFAFLPHYQPFPGPIDDTQRENDAKERAKDVRRRVQLVIDAACKHMPIEHRDRRYYIDDTKKQLNNPGLGWSLYLAENAWLLDGARALRGFAGSPPPASAGTAQNKDALTGREEAVAGGKEWKEKCGTLSGGWKKWFKSDAWLGGPTLVKRLWHKYYLQDIAGFLDWDRENNRSCFAMPNTRAIARHDPFADSADEDEGDNDDASYFAVLALDGDDMGKWVSGEKCPPLRDQLASYSDDSGNAMGALPYFAKISSFAEVLAAPRPLTPAFHLQFSEALANFALKCARPIVEAYDGRLIYAGGDDVLAMLPADSALNCAEALHLAFCGDPGLADFLSSAPKPITGLKVHTYGLPADGFPGFLHIDGYADLSKRPIPFVVPGRKADVSVGIAIAHHKAPLQDVVRTAQAAEKRAKKVPGKAAVAVSILKRSGETSEWVTKWDSGGLALLRHWRQLLQSNKLSARFPYKLTEFLEAYVAGQSKGFHTELSLRIVELIDKDVSHAIAQSGGEPQESTSFVQSYAKKLLMLDCESNRKAIDISGSENACARQAISSLLGLLAMLAWLNKHEVAESTPHQSTKTQVG